MHANELIEIICATHLSSYVGDSEFTGSGGLMLVGAPSTLKSTFLSVVERNYPATVTASDINAQALGRMRDQIASGAIRTLVLPELSKIYKRAESTAMNVEGTIQALVDEGFSEPSFNDHRMNTIKAHCVVMSALTPATQRKHFSRWEDEGFNRRFLWPLIRLKDPGALERSVVAWQRIKFQTAHVPRLPEGAIPNLTTVAERQELHGLLKYQPGGSAALQLQLMTRILGVLKWWYREIERERDAMATMRAFGEALGRNGSTVEVDDLPTDRVSSSASTLASARWRKPATPEPTTGKKAAKKGGKR